MPKSPVFIVLVALSVLCSLILLGLYRYTGSILPATEGASGDELRGIWLMWAALAAVPVITVLWWAGAAIARRLR